MAHSKGKEERALIDKRVRLTMAKKKKISPLPLRLRSQSEGGELYEGDLSRRKRRACVEKGEVSPLRKVSERET